MAVTSFNHFPELALAMHEALSDIVAETTVYLGDMMIAQIYANGQIDTGFMVDSVYTVTKNGSTYGQGSIEPPGDAYLMPEETISSDMEGVAACAANYSGFQNYGTRYLPPRPFREPAMDLAKAEYEAKLAQLESRMHV
jgi:hypothetical protein